MSRRPPEPVNVDVYLGIDDTFRAVVVDTHAIIKAHRPDTSGARCCRGCRLPAQSADGDVWVDVHTWGCPVAGVYPDRAPHVLGLDDVLNAPAPNDNRVAVRRDGELAPTMLGWWPPPADWRPAVKLFDDLDLYRDDEVDPRSRRHARCRGALWWLRSWLPFRLKGKTR